jgi:hypothetical protein
MSGCGKETTTVKTPEGEVKVTTQDKNTTVTNGDNKIVVSNNGKDATYKTNDGTVEGQYSMSGNVKLPDGYPFKLAPILDTGKVILAQKTKDESTSKDGYSLTYSINKDKLEIVNKYKEIMKGYKDFAEMSMGNYVLSGTKDLFEISVMINDNMMTDNKDKTSVTIGITPYSE